MKLPSVVRKLHSRTIRKRLVWLARTPFFWWITLWGNVCIFGGAVVFHVLERGHNPGLVSFIDSLAWAVGIVTTVGGGAVSPVTPLGKILMILMMMGGAVFLWSYMALFVGTLVDPELNSIQKDISEIQQDVKDDEQTLVRLRSAVEQLERRLKTSGKKI